MYRCAHEGCDNYKSARGLCQKHYQQALKEGKFGDNPTKFASIKKLIHETDECIDWPGALRSYRYPACRHNGKDISVTRYLCEKYYGPPPYEKAVAMHKCNNTKCINPRHLMWGTQSQNQLHRHRGELPD